LISLSGVDYTEFPGVLRVKLPMPGPLNHVYSYIVLSGDRGVIVDAGFSRNDEGYVGFVERIMDKVRIDYLVITHMHSDHFGCAHRLRELGIRSVAHGADVSLSRLTRNEFLEENRRVFMDSGVPRDELDLFIGIMMYSEYVPPDIDVVVWGDEELGGVKLLWTPGHTPGHLSILSDHYLFSGDFILPRITPHVGVYPGSPGNPLADYFNSLIKVADLDVKLILPAHQSEFTQLKARVMELFRHHLGRLCEILRILASPRSVFQVASELKWTRRGLSYWELDPMSRMMAVTETLAHIKYLEEGGYVRPGEGLYRLVGNPRCEPHEIAPQASRILEMTEP